MCLDCKKEECTRDRWYYGISEWHAGCKIVCNLGYYTGIVTTLLWKIGLGYDVFPAACKATAQVYGMMGGDYTHCAFHSGNVLRFCLLNVKII